MTENELLYTNQSQPCRCFENSTFHQSSYFSQFDFNCTNTTWKGDKPVAVAQLFFEWVLFGNKRILEQKVRSSDYIPDKTFIHNEF